MSFYYLLLCALLGSMCTLALCAFMENSGKTLAAPHTEISQKTFLPGNLAAPVTIAVCSLCAVGTGVNFGLVQPSKVNLLQLSAGLVFSTLISLFGLWDDTLRIFGGSHIGLPFGSRQAVLAIICAVYTWLQSRIGGTALVVLGKNFDLGIWYCPICTLLCMAVLFGVQALFSRPACCHVLVLFAAAGVLPLLGKLSNGPLSVLCAVTAGSVCTLFLHSYPAVRVYMGSCTNLFLGGVVCCGCVVSVPAVSTVSALAIIAVGILAAVTVAFPLAKGAKNLFSATHKTFIDICIAAGFVCAAAAGIATIYL